MENIHGLKGSEDRGPGAIVATCLDVCLKGQPTHKPKVQPTKLSISAHRVRSFFGAGDSRPLPGLCLTWELKQQQQ